MRRKRKIEGEKMKVNRDDLKWYIQNIKYLHKRSDEKDRELTDEEFADKLANFIETNPGCIDVHGVSDPGRYSYSTVGYGVFSLFGEKYSMGRIEVHDRENESGYAVHEGIYTMPHKAANQFQDFMDSLETELPIHIEIGSHNWCAEECAKSLGFNDQDEMRDEANVKAYRKSKNDEFAREKGYKDFDDMLANSKWNKKQEQ